MGGGGGLFGRVGLKWREGEKARCREKVGVMGKAVVMQPGMEAKTAEGQNPGNRGSDRSRSFGASQKFLKANRSGYTLGVVIAD